MSIAGFDPSGGAGTLADIKTFEQLKVYGFAVLTANTFQSDSEVKRVDWFPIGDILSQIDVILDQFEVNYFKIGITSGSEMFEAIKSHVLKRRPKAKITWDPVLTASAGKDFFEGKTDINSLIKGLALLTPNSIEFDKLIGSPEKAIELSKNTLIYLKGGHNTAKPGTDTLYWKGKTFNFNPQESRVSEKHGSGCAMASALTANLALGFKPLQASLKSKRYIESVLSSNTSLLGYHKR